MELARSDLDFILANIKVSEPHAATGYLPNLTPEQIAGLLRDSVGGDPHLPFGVRTVNGTYNNLVEGNHNWGSADQVMPRALTATFRNDDDGDVMPFGPFTLTNTDYDTATDVVDADPRIISNLIVDQSLNNPAAIAAALAYLGSDNLEADTARVSTEHAEAKAAKQAAADALQTLNDLTDAGAPPEEIDAAQAVYDQAVVDAAIAADDLDDVLSELGLTVDNNTVVIPNVSPDVGLSAPFNSWFTLFGQFFDHGLDLVNKGGNGLVYIPLQPDDPLYVEGSHTNFMVVTRATNQSGGAQEHVNQTTPFIDQNQTYTSHASHQVFLREYALDADGKPYATGKMLEGSGPNGGLATWADIKEQARTKLGIELGDFDVLSVPLLATDAYGRFIPGANGFPQIIFEDAEGNLYPPVEGDPAAPKLTHGTMTVGEDVIAVHAVRTGHAFLDDIAHHAAPGFYDHDHNPATDPIAKVADADPGTTDDHLANTYDDELLNAHFITGDGRGNENIGLTAVHFVFHAEHNRMIEEIKGKVADELAKGEDADVTFVREWLVDGATANIADGIQEHEWHGERLFQAARLTTEMQYQHLVFEEFGRKVQPTIDLFLDYDTAINPAIVAEFAHVVYRFGHSMLTESVDRVGAGGDMGLIEAFLNPLAFADGVSPAAAAGAIVSGMTRQVGNEIDEFVTEALRNNLVGLPLDLAAINLARGRETGVPSLNAARREFFNGSGDSALKPYESWYELGLNLKHEASLINFIAAYGTHEDIVDAGNLADKRAIATALVTGVTMRLSDGTDYVPDDDDRFDFLNGEGAWASNTPLGVTKTGLDDVDLWIGGLAERQMPFGGMLGTTFNFIFETQMEQLQNGDRFYYLHRLAGTNMLAELEQGSFADLVMRNTDGPVHLPHDIFSRPDFIIEAGDQSTWPDTLVIRNQTTGAIRFIGDQHVVMGGTAGVDRLTASEGDDTLWGDGGNDILEGGFGNDAILGGDGDDRMTDSFGDDVMKGGLGRDTINGGAGFDLIIGGDGDDIMDGGSEMDEIFAGHGNDIAYGGSDADELLGGEGDDWLEGGIGSDGLTGDSGFAFGPSPIMGHDVLVGGQGADGMDGENGDDIFLGGEGADRHFGRDGFDWMAYQGNVAADGDLELDAEILLPPGANESILDRFRWVEAISGSDVGDRLRGDDWTTPVPPPPPDPAEPEPPEVIVVTPFDPGVIAEAVLDAAGMARINGLRALLNPVLDPDNPTFTGGNIILGGRGSDVMEGRGGDDFIDGDHALHVSLSTVAGVGNQIHRIITNDALATDSDVAVFSGIRADYDVTIDWKRDEFGDVLFDENDNPIIGGVRIVHSRGDATDSTAIGDYVQNVEVFRFLGGGLATDNVALADILNRGPSGPATGILLPPLTEDTPVTFALADLLAGWVDLDGQVLTVDLPGAYRFVDNGDGEVDFLDYEASGVLVDNGDGTFTFTPDLNDDGEVVILYGVSDGIETIATSATMDITPDDDAPTALADAFTVNEDGAVGGNVLDNDSGAAGMTASLVSGPANGILALNTDGTFTYTPSGNFNGIDSFTYAALVGTAASAPTTVTITVNAINDAPTATGLTRALTIAEDAAPASLFAAGVSVGDIDSPSVTATLTLSNPAAGVLTGTNLTPTATPGVYTITGAASLVSAALASVQFDSAANFSGAANVTVAVSDGQTGSQGVNPTGTVAITVTPVNDAPTATGLSRNVTIAEDAAAALLFAAVPVIADIDSPNITATLTLSNAAAGVLTGVTQTATPGVYSITGTTAAVSAALAAVRFDSAANFNGAANVAVTISDGPTAGPQGVNPTGTVAFTVTPVNDAPTGQVTLGMNAAAGTLTATHNLVDPDGLGAVTFRWESSTNGTTWLNTGVTGATFTPPAAPLPQYRAVATYIDGGGTSQQVISTEVARVGTGGANTINGAGAPDVILGLAGNDILGGGDGADVLSGGLGTDTVNGNAGDDLFLATANDGNDTYNGGAGTGDTYSIAGITANGTVIDLNANTGSGGVTGTDGLQGIENAIGGSGADTLVSGNAERNVLTGGGGADTFRFDGLTGGAIGTGATRDLITDFQIGLDRINVSAIDASGAAAGNNAFLTVAQGTGFTGEAQIRYSFETINGVEHTIVRGNINANTAADFEIDLVGRHDLTAANFVL